MASLPVDTSGQDAIVVWVARDPVYRGARGDEQDLAAHERHALESIALRHALFEVPPAECALEFFDDPVG